MIIADNALDAIRGTLRRIHGEHPDPVSRIALSPNLFEALTAAAKSRCTYPSDRSLPHWACEIDGIRVENSPVLPPGSGWVFQVDRNGGEYLAGKIEVS